MISEPCGTLLFRPPHLADQANLIDRRIMLQLEPAAIHKI
jgi:hypothetical protein